MNKLKSVMSLVVASFLLLSPAVAKEKVRYAYVLDPIYEAMIYAVKSGKLTSDAVDVELVPISVPAIVQALATKQYDVVNAAAVQIPEAIARGIDLKLLSVSVRYPRDSIGVSIWVKKDSPYKSLSDLKGKTIAISTFNSGNTTMTRIAISKKHKMNVSFDNGDFHWVEIPTGVQLSALSTGKVDASTLLHSHAIKASLSGEFRVIMKSTQEFYDVYGVKPVTGTNVAFPDRLAAHPKAYMEFDRLMKESRDYALKNIDEVANAAAKITGTTPDLIKVWLNSVGEFQASIGEDDMKSIQVTWEAQKELGLISKVPDIHDVVWEHAQRP